MADEENPGNEVVFALVFIVLFLPPLAVISLQIYRAFVYAKNRKAIVKIFWIKFQDSSVEVRLNVHLLLKLAFAFICLVRVIQGLLFLFQSLLSDGPANVGMDNALRWWIPYIATTLMFTAVCVLLYYWLELGRLTSPQMGKLRPAPVPLIYAVGFINAVFHTLTFVLLSIFIKTDRRSDDIQGEGYYKTFQQVYFYAVCLPMLVFAYLGLFWVPYSISRTRRTLSIEDGQKLRQDIRKAYYKMGWFTIFVLIAFSIRVILDFALIYFDFSVTVAATLSFIWNSVPELILTGALCWITWIRKSRLVPSPDQEQLVSSTVAPEIEYDDSTEMSSTR